jgi:dienelactone hydrolase
LKSLGLKKNSSMIAVLLATLAAAQPRSRAYVPSPFLPPLRVNAAGKTVRTPAEWRARRQELASDVQEYILGHAPTQAAPSLIAADTINTTVLPEGGSSAFVRLAFDTKGGGGGVDEVAVVVEVLRGASAGAEKRPLFITQWTHRPWALYALSRGYAAILYPGCDTADVAPLFQAAYPNATMALIMARAYVASRVLDYALDPERVPFVDASRVAITGHSRNGKQSVVAAAFDERITAVVGSSPGSPVATPFRFSSCQFYGQDAVTSPPPSPWYSWWTPKCREFAGREADMPTDGHAIQALVAPRALALATGYADSEGDETFGNEWSLREVHGVYADLLGAGDNVSMLYRPGDHHGYIDVPGFFDFFGRAFAGAAGGQKARSVALGGGALERPPAPSLLSSFVTPAGFSWEAWHAATNASAGDAPPPTAKLTQRVAWVLDAPVFPPGGAVGALSVPDAYCEEANPGQYITEMLRHNPGNRGDKRYVNVSAVAFSFGGYVTATVYYDHALAALAAPAMAAPAAIWLHAYGYNRGFDTGGNNTDTYLELAKAGYVVFAFDLTGFGMRVANGGARYYDRRGGRGSLMAQHVADTGALLEAALCLTAAGRRGGGSEAARCAPPVGFSWSTKALEAVPDIDPAAVYVGGYALGGAVALHAAAGDKRFAGSFSVAGFTPMRTDRGDDPARSTGGLRRLSELHALVPRLGLFVGNEKSVPYDYDELLAAVAPRPVLLVTPRRDRDADFKDVCASVGAAREAWAKKGEEALLEHVVVDDYLRLSANVTQVVVAWASGRRRLRVQ